MNKTIKVQKSLKTVEKEYKDRQLAAYKELIAFQAVATAVVKKFYGAEVTTLDLKFLDTYGWGNFSEFLKLRSFPWSNVTTEGEFFSFVIKPQRVGAGNVKVPLQLMALPTREFTKRLRNVLKSHKEALEAEAKLKAERERKDRKASLEKQLKEIQKELSKL